MSARRFLLLVLVVGSVPGLALAADLTVTATRLTTFERVLTYADTTPPTPTSVTANNVGSNTAGRAEKNDTVVIVFSEPIRPSTLCSTWTTTGPQSLADNADNLFVTIANNAAPGTLNDELRIASSAATRCGGSPTIGVIDLGSKNFVTGDISFNGTGSNRSELHWDGTATLTIKLGSGGPTATVGSVKIVYTPHPGIKDLAGNSITGTVSRTAVAF